MWIIKQLNQDGFWEYVHHTMDREDADYVVELLHQIDADSIVSLTWEE